jgi:CheY-like chemotaxis protein
MSHARRGSLDEKLAALRAQVIAGLPARGRELRDAVDRLAAGDRSARDDARRSAHKLRGIAGTYGLGTLGALSEEVERLAADEAAGDAQVAARALALVAAIGRDSKAPPPPAPPDASRAPAPSLAGLRVLAIDDDASMRRLVEITLRTIAGCEPRVASSPKEAFALAEAEPFDVAIVDAMMPGTTGLAVANGIRERRSSIAIAFLSAARLDDLGWSLPEGAVWLRKPFRPRDLVDRIATLAGRA